MAEWSRRESNPRPLECHLCHGPRQHPKTTEKKRKHRHSRWPFSDTVDAVSFPVPTYFPHRRTRGEKPLNVGQLFLDQHRRLARARVCHRWAAHAGPQGRLGTPAGPICAASLRSDRRLVEARRTRSGQIPLCGRFLQLSEKMTRTAPRGRWPQRRDAAGVARQGRDPLAGARPRHGRGHLAGGDSARVW
jgi:hypothetical protein